MLCLCKDMQRPVMGGSFIPQCKTRGCTRACATIDDDSQDFIAYCSADCMVGKGVRTDSEGGPCINRSVTGCANSREPDGSGGYSKYCCRACREGLGVSFRKNEDGDGEEMDDFGKMFPTLG
jgi:hypothetical protein